MCCSDTRCLSKVTLTLGFMVGWGGIPREPKIKFIDTTNTQSDFPTAKGAV